MTRAKQVVDVDEGLLGERAEGLGLHGHKLPAPQRLRSHSADVEPAVRRKVLGKREERVQGAGHGGHPLRTTSVVLQLLCASRAVSKRSKGRLFRRTAGPACVDTPGGPARHKTRAS